MRRPLLAVVAVVLGVSSSVSAQVFDPARYRVVDLSHAYNADTVYWPTSPTRFELKQLSFGETPGGWFYSAYAVCTPEHGGTHLDAPIHFAAGKRTSDAVPVEDLVAPAVVIDVTAAAAADQDFALRVTDVEAFERQHGTIGPGTIVLVRTGWSRRWPNTKAYLGDDTPGDASKLHFPGFGADAARLLVSRGARVIGIDTASLDPGRAQDFPVHRAVMAQDVAGLENLTNLDRLPPRGAIVIALPMKVEGGSGGPLRAIALVPR